MANITITGNGNYQLLATNFTWFTFRSNALQPFDYLVLKTSDAAPVPTDIGIGVKLNQLNEFNVVSSTSYSLYVKVPNGNVVNFVINYGLSNSGGIGIYDTTRSYSFRDQTFIDQTSINPTEVWNSQVTYLAGAPVTYNTSTTEFGTITAISKINNNQTVPFVTAPTPPSVLNYQRVFTASRTIVCGVYKNAILFAPFHNQTGAGLFQWFNGVSTAISLNNFNWVSSDFEYTSDNDIKFVAGDANPGVFQGYYLSSATFTYNSATGLSLTSQAIEFVNTGNYIQTVKFDPISDKIYYGNNSEFGYYSGTTKTILAGTQANGVAFDSRTGYVVFNTSNTKIFKFDSINYTTSSQSATALISTTITTPITINELELDSTGNFITLTYLGVTNSITFIDISKDSYSTTMPSYISYTQSVTSNTIVEFQDLSFYSNTLVLSNDTQGFGSMTYILPVISGAFGANWSGVSPSLATFLTDIPAGSLTFATNNGLVKITTL